MEKRPWHQPPMIPRLRADWVGLVSRGWPEVHLCDPYPKALKADKAGKDSFIGGPYHPVGHRMARGVAFCRWTAVAATNEHSGVPHWSQECLKWRIQLPGWLSLAGTGLSWGWLAWIGLGQPGRLLGTLNDGKHHTLEVGHRHRTPSLQCFHLDTQVHSSHRSTSAGGMGAREGAISNQHGWHRRRAGTTRWAMGRTGQGQGVPCWQQQARPHAQGLSIHRWAPSNSKDRVHHCMWSALGHDLR